MLRLGKIRENVLLRSVIKEIKNKRKEVIIGSKMYEDASVVSIDNEDSIVISTDPITVYTSNSTFMCVNNSLNNILAMGAKPIGITISILLPENSEEALLKSIIRQAEDVCRLNDIQIIGGHTEVTKAVSTPVITTTAIGSVNEKDLLKASEAKPGDDIIISKWVGLEGTCMIANEHRKMLCDKFPMAFVQKANDFDKEISIAGEIEAIKNCGVTSVHDMASGGVFAALWEMAESSKVGLDIDLKAIPFKQETIEISEIFGINPYELHSGGSLLITSEDGLKVVMELEKAGIFGTVVGKVTSGADRILRNEDETRYLEPPKADEILKVL